MRTKSHGQFLKNSNELTIKYGIRNMVRNFFKQNSLDKILLLSFVLAPLLGSITLAATIYLVSFSLFDFKYRAKEHRPEYPFKLIGLIFVIYFCSLAFLETFHAPTIITQIRELGKIFPIFVIGAFAYFLDSKRFKLTYKSVGDAAVIGIYLTLSIACFLKLLSLLFPDFLAYSLGGNDLGVSGGRLTLGSGNALPFGTLLITISFITLLEISKKNSLNQIISFGAFIIGIATVIFWNGSRGPSLAGVPLLLLAVWYLVLGKELKENRVIVSLIATCVIITSAMFFTSDSKVLQNLSIGLNVLLDFKPNFEIESSLGQRVVMYKAAFETFLQNPMLGYGIVNKFSSVIPILQRDGYTFTYTHLHSTFLNHMLSAGLFGLLSISVLIITPLIDLYRRKIAIPKEGYYFSLIIMISMVFNGLTNVLIMHDLIAHFFGILILTNAICHYNSNKNLSISPK